MAKRIKYVTGNKAADREIAYLKKKFPNNRAANRQIKYLLEKFGAQTLSGKAERSRTSARDRAPKKPRSTNQTLKLMVVKWTLQRFQVLSLAKAQYRKGKK